MLVTCKKTVVCIPSPLDMPIFWCTRFEKGKDLQTDDIQEDKLQFGNWRLLSLLMLTFFILDLATTKHKSKWLNKIISQPEQTEEVVCQHYLTIHMNTLYCSLLDKGPLSGAALRRKVFQVSEDGNCLLHFR